MARIEWQESYTVYDDELDNHHRELLRLYNDLHESLLSDSIDYTQQTKRSTLIGLKDYISNHFSCEETFLKEINYPEATKHQELHLEFKNKIETIIKEHEDGVLILSTQLLKVLRNWIIDHLTKADFYFGQYNKMRQK